MLTEVLTQNISAIVMAGIFIWYMNKRDKMVQEVFDNFSRKIEKLTSALNKLESRFKHIESKTKRGE